jgi:unsaturated rhamnogalacturonyl hydrolase
MSLLLSSSASRACATALLALSISATAAAQITQNATMPGNGGQRPGRSDAAFSQPSLAVGVDYTVPSPDEIKIVLDRVLEYFVRSTEYRIIDTATGKPVTDFTTPIKTAAVDKRLGEFNDWTYPMGVSLAGMLHVADVTGDQRFREYVFRNLDFMADHVPYFRKQNVAFGPQRDGWGRLFNMHELDDCGAMGAAVVKAYELKPDPRYRELIDLSADFVSNKMSRLPDGTLARTRPWPVAIWVDDFYMSIPLLARMGKLTGDKKYYDDAARQVIQMSARLLDERTQLYDHSWFGDMEPDPKFYWGRGAGWALMATAELLTVLPADHADRPKVLGIFQKAAQGVIGVQSGTGMWHQMLDKTDSYLETSATAMFTFALARGVNRGWLPPSYAPAAQAGWRAIEQRVRADGMIEGICVSTTAAADLTYYYNRPTDLAASQGYGPVLMAGAEVLTMVKAFDIQRANNTYYYRPRK